MPRYKRSRGRKSYRSYDSGYERARQHIEDARRLSAELGGTDEDVKAYFFSLPPSELQSILEEYGNLYGADKREYAEMTIDKWRTGRVHMSGTVASRLFAMLPPRMPLTQKYKLIESLWNHVSPSSKKILRVGLDAPVDDVAQAVRSHVDEVVLAHRIPEGMERRFEWLAAGDSHVKQDLLNYLRGIEKALAEQAVRAQLPVLLQHLQSERGSNTHRLAQVLKIGKHELELLIDKTFSGVAVVEPYSINRYSRGRDDNWTWLWWLGGAIILILFLMTRR